MRGLGTAIATLGLCLAGCGAETGSNEAATNGVGGNEAAGNGAGPAATAEAGGPCPFEMRGWRATTGDSPAPGGGRQVTISVEHRPDSEGRQPTMSQRLTPPPDIVLDIDRDPMAEPSPDREWGEIGIGGYPATPDYTHAVIRCLGTQVARVPIQR